MCMCQTRGGGLVYKLTWLIVALAAINIGLAAANVFDFNNIHFMVDHPHAKVVLGYLIGIAGILSLFALLAHSYRCMSGKECQMNPPPHSHR